MMAIDLSAVFGTADHDILLEVLQKQYGISGNALKWFNNYLQPRSFCVNIGDSYSYKTPLNFSVSQGSCTGPILYSNYASTMKYIVPAHMSLQEYADDHAIKLTFSANNISAEATALRSLENCAEDIKQWMDSNRFKMNSSKTEFILFGHPKQLRKCSSNYLKVCEDVSLSVDIRYLGVYLDSQLSFKQHITHKCKVAMLNIHKIRNIRSTLTTEATHTLVLGLVTSHLDFCNSVLFGLPKYSIKKLQRVQNIAAKLVLNRTKHESSTESRKQLHWLPIAARIEFKIIVLVYKCLHRNAPEYLQKS